MQTTVSAAAKMIHGATTIRSVPVIRAALGVSMLSVSVHPAVVPVW